MWHVCWIMYDIGCMLMVNRDSSWYLIDYQVYMGSSTIVWPLAGYHCTCALINWTVLLHCPPCPIPTVLHHLATRSNATCKHQKYYLFATSEQVYCNIRTRQLQQQNKATAMRDARSEKETNCWRSLTSIINHQYILHMYLISSPNIGIGV